LRIRCDDLTKDIEEDILLRSVRKAARYPRALQLGEAGFPVWGWDMNPLTLVQLLDSLKKAQDERMAVPKA